MREHALGLFRVPHIFLNPKIVHAQIKMQRRCDAHRTHIRGPVASRPHVIQFGQACDLSQMGNPARVHHGRPNVINQLFLNELLAIVNRVEHFADRNRRCRVLPDQPKTFLQLRWRRIFQPEQVIWFETLSEPSRLNRRQPVVRIVQQRNVFAKLFSQPLE